MAAAEGPVFTIVKLAGEVTVVEALEHVVAVPPEVAHEAPGVGGDDPPDGSIEA
jgi:hypothetical protein